MREIRSRRDATLRVTSLDRREFLRWMAGGIAAVAAPGLAGCGGGGGSPQGGGGPVMPSGERSAALDAVEAKATSLNLRDMPNANQQMLQFMQTRGEFQRVGLSNDGCVWGVFTDGALYRFINNRHPDTQPAPAATKLLSRAPVDSVPKSSRVYCLHGLGTYLPSATAEIRQMLLANGYTEAIGAGGLATLDAMRNVRNAGVLYLSTHGGDGDGGFGFTTCTPVTDALEKDPTNQQEVKDGLLIYCSVTLNEKFGGLFGGEVVRVYGLTNKFIKKYMTFGPFSMAYFDACSSDDLLVKQACFDAGAGLFAGWTAPVRNGVSNASSTFFFDRLLGANTEDPKEDPPQRPFDFESVYDDMKKRGLDTSPGDAYATAKLLFSLNGLSPDFALLAPTIKQMDVDETNNRLILHGIFGHDKGIVRVNDSTDLNVESWAPDKVVCTLPRTGPGSAGSVVAIVQQHKSNARQLTLWEMNIRYKWTDIGRPGLVVQGPVKLRYRMDIGDYRNKPAEAPQQPTRTADAIGDSQTTQVASGTWSDGNASSTWSGEMTFVSPLSTIDTPGKLVNRLLVNAKTKTGAVGLAYGHPTGQMFTEVDTGPGGSITQKFAIAFGILDGATTFPDPLGLPGAPDLPLPALNLTFDDGYAIAARTYEGLSGAIHIEWDRTVPQYPPDPQAGRSVPIARR